MTVKEFSGQSFCSASNTSIISEHAICKKSNISCDAGWNFSFTVSTVRLPSTLFILHYNKNLHLKIVYEFMLLLVQMVYNRNWTSLKRYLHIFLVEVCQDISRHWDISTLTSSANGITPKYTPHNLLLF